MSRTEALRIANNLAWDSYRALLNAYPAARTEAQEQAVQRAHAHAMAARDAYDRANFWANHESISV